MRRSFIISAYLLYCLTSLNAQYSRAIYTTQEQGRSRTFDIVESNGTTHFVGLKESDNDTLRIVFGEIDQKGETSNYSQLEDYSLSFSNIALIGTGANSNGDIVLSVLTNNAGGSIHYITLSSTNGTILGIESLPEDYESVYTRSRDKGDSLITYAVEQGVGLKRIAMSKNNTQAYSSALIDNTITFTGSLSGDVRRIELKIDNNGNERILAGNKFYVRSATGVVSSSIASSLLFQEFAGTTFETNDAGLTLLLSGKKYELLNTSLASVGNGILNVDIINNFKFNELSHDSNDWVLFSSDLQNQLKRIILNPVLSVVNEEIMSLDVNKPLNYSEINGNRYLVLEQWETTYGGAVDLISNAIINFDSNWFASKFWEYNCLMDNGNYQYSATHLAYDFLDDNSTAGIKYVRNNIEYPMNFITFTYLSGMDGNANLYVDQFHNQPDYISLPGPFSNLTDFNQEQKDKYNRGYYVDKDMIEAHLLAITNNDPNYQIPFGIEEWPAHGDISLGQAQDLAPFFDGNNNGVYEPELGDYPSIYGTKCVLFIYHAPSFINTPGIEHHRYTYLFECDTVNALNNSIFVTEKIIARNGEYNNAYFTKWIDDDIGNGFDDYVGTNVDLGMVYSYNGDLFDEDNSGNFGFHDSLAATGFMFLKGVPLPNDGLDNPPSAGLPVNGHGFGDGIIDNETSTIESSIRHPYTPQGYFMSGMYYMAQGLLPDGSPNSNGTIDIHYDFYGNEDQSFYASGGIPHTNNYFESGVPGDRQILGSSGEFNLNASNEYSIEFTMAYMSYVDTAASFDNLWPVKQLFNVGWDVKQLFEDNYAGCDLDFGLYASEETLSLSEITAEHLILYPNPANKCFVISGDVQGELQVDIFTIGGAHVLSQLVQSESPISIEELTNGIYLVQVTTNGSKQTQRLVIQ